MQVTEREQITGSVVAEGKSRIRKLYNPFGGPSWEVCFDSEAYTLDTWKDAVWFATLGQAEAKRVWGNWLRPLGVGFIPSHPWKHTSEYRRLMDMRNRFNQQANAGEIAANELPERIREFQTALRLLEYRAGVGVLICK